MFRGMVVFTMGLLLLATFTIHPRAETLSTVGPDAFGYLAEVAVPFSWTDTNEGLDTGIHEYGDYSGPIQIGFPFKYYENSYTEIYASFFGCLTFAPQAMDNPNLATPDPGLPNNLIAPFTLPVDWLGGYVHYLQGGTAPERWFVVEWNRLIEDTSFGPMEYTFEVTLHENGDIVFQYKAPSYSTVVLNAGIENATGLDGLFIYYQYFTDFAIHIYRPAPAVRVGIDYAEQGDFVTAGQHKTYTFVVHNTGDLGTDTFDFNNVSSNWPLTFHNTNDNAPLTDTDGDGAIDTGPILQGGWLTVNASVHIPVVVNVGDDDTISMEVTSSLEPAIYQTVTLQAAVPAPFAQAFLAPDNLSPSFYLMLPEGHAVMNSMPDVSLSSYFLALGETPAGYAYVWTVYGSDETNPWGWRNIQYTLFDKQGKMIHPVNELTTNEGMPDYVFDTETNVAVTSDGKIGIVWVRFTRLSANTQFYNFNLYYAILNPMGEVIVPPTNLTNNQAWGYYSPGFFEPKIVATEDNRFFLSWHRGLIVAGANPSDTMDIFTSILDSQGNPIQAPVNRTNYTGYDHSRYSNLTPMDNGRVLLAYNKKIVNNEDAYLRYIVIDSTGTQVMDEALILGMNQDYEFTSTRLSNGRILIAWADYSTASPEARFVILDPTGQNILYGPTTFGEAINPNYEYGLKLSATSDGNGNAIITWRSGSSTTIQQIFYYSLVDNNGNILTQPSIFFTTLGYGDASFPLHGLAPNTELPTFPGVDDQINAPTRIGGQPNTPATIPITFSNRGALTSTDISINVTLPITVTYLSDTSGIAPTVNGNTLAWHIPNEMAFLGHGAFTIQIALPAGDIGTIFPVTVEISAAQADDNPADNVITTQLMLAHQFFVPVTIH